MKQLLSILKNNRQNANNDSQSDVVSSPSTTGNLSPRLTALARLLTPGDSLDSSGDDYSPIDLQTKRKRNVMIGLSENEIEKFQCSSDFIKRAVIFNITDSVKKDEGLSKKIKSAENNRFTKDKAFISIFKLLNDDNNSVNLKIKHILRYLAGEKPYARNNVEDIFSLICRDLIKDHRMYYLLAKRDSIPASNGLFSNVHQKPNESYVDCLIGFEYK